MSEVEPYTFVRLPEGGPKRKPPLLHHRHDEEAQSGRLICRLTAKTPLFVYDPSFAHQMGGGHERADFPVRNGVAMIPGSSLKGVVRSVAEAVESCCFTLFDSFYRGGGVTRGKTLKAILPRDYEHCTHLGRLCPACRLFGSLKGDMLFAGKVTIGDARAEAGAYELADWIVLDVLSAPKPEGRPRVYTQSDGRIVRGRKFYRHRLNGVLTRLGGRQDRQNKTVRPVAAGASFTFEVEYTDLRAEELRLLLYALALEPGLWHKVGMGKPIGLGSAQIEIVGWTQINRQTRYRVLGGGMTESLTESALQTELDRWLRPYRESNAPNLQDLREAWRYEHSYEVRYQTQRPR
ncbi:MAG: RAMP superfamily CRISPR-associated protein [Ardenticatenaceae bacterium]|nr:RAMP superfamily CRISPR-associated protein [Ardenticatenaceae bacterium]